MDSCDPLSSAIRCPGVKSMTKYLTSLADAPRYSLPRYSGGGQGGGSATNAVRRNRQQRPHANPPPEYRGRAKSVLLIVAMSSLCTIVLAAPTTQPFGSGIKDAQPGDVLLMP